MRSYVVKIFKISRLQIEVLIYATLEYLYQTRNELEVFSHQPHITVRVRGRVRVMVRVRNEVMESDGFIDLIVSKFFTK